MAAAGIPAGIARLIASGRAPGELEVFSDLSVFLKRPGLKIAVSERRLEGEKILYLIPRLVTLGTGCRRGISPAVFKEQITECLKEAGIFANNQWVGVSGISGK